MIIPRWNQENDGDTNRMYQATFQRGGGRRRSNYEFHFPLKRPLFPARNVLRWKIDFARRRDWIPFNIHETAASVYCFDNYFLLLYTRRIYTKNGEKTKKHNEKKKKPVRLYFGDSAAAAAAVLFLFFSVVVDVFLRPNVSNKGFYFFLCFFFTNRARAVV